MKLGLIETGLGALQCKGGWVADWTREKIGRNVQTRMYISRVADKKGF